jgi:hypothetical protein
VDAAHQLPFYSPSSPFNIPVASGASVDPGSDAMVQGLVAGAGGGFSIGAREWTTPVYYADASTPKTTVKLTVSWAAARGISGVPIPANAQPDPAGDHHLSVLDPVSQCEYDFWQAQHNADGSWSASWGNAIKLTGTGVFAGGWATTASGVANTLGKIRPEELKAGHIDHALVVGIPNTRSGGPVLPATASDGKSSGAGTIPEGARIQLDPSLDLSTMGLNAWQTTIARALQTYGMFVGDSGGTVGLSAINANSLPAGSYPWGDASYASLPKALLSKMRVLTLGAQYQPKGYLDTGGCATFLP